MIYIAHRINTLKDLAGVPAGHGVELDLRDRGNDLVLAHDPFMDGERFEEYLQAYHHGPMVLNIKSERIEGRVTELIKKFSIKEYFFLDSSFPMMRLLASSGEKNIAVRFSEFEGLDTVMALQGALRWVWVDCFTKLPVDRRIFTLLKQGGFKLCLVSPELQGRPQDIEHYARYLLGEGIVFDAICTKLSYIDQWQRFFP